MPRYALQDKKEIVSLYVHVKLSPDRIAPLFGKDRSAIKMFLKRQGVLRSTQESAALSVTTGRKSMEGAIQLQKHRKSLPDRECAKCGDMFHPENVNAHKWCDICCPDESALSRLKTYNMSHPEYELMYYLQNGLCAVCDVEPAWIVDHMHHGCENGSKATCGKCVRGLVCRACNLFLAALDAHPDLIASGLAYIEKAKQRLGQLRQ